MQRDCRQHGCQGPGKHEANSKSERSKMLCKAWTNPGAVVSVLRPDSSSLSLCDGRMQTGKCGKDGVNQTLTAASRASSSAVTALTHAFTESVKGLNAARRIVVCVIQWIEGETRRLRLSVLTFWRAALGNCVRASTMDGAASTTDCHTRTTATNSARNCRYGEAR